jgi:hypothetical protein
MLIRDIDGKRPFGRPSIDGKILLKLIFGKYVGVDWIRMAQEE